MVSLSSIKWKCAPSSLIDPKLQLTILLRIDWRVYLIFIIWLTI